MRFDLQTGTREKHKLDADTSGDLAAGADAIWATLTGSGQVVRVGFKNRRDPAYIAVGISPVGVVATGRKVWVASRTSSTVTRIDARTLRPREEINVPIDPYEMTAYGGAIWVTSLARGSVTRNSAPAQ